LLRDIYKKPTLAIISDTAISGSFKAPEAFEPVVRELEHLSVLFRSLHWLGYKRSFAVPANHRNPTNAKINLIGVVPTGGNSFINKLLILQKLPEYFVIINYLIKRTNVIYTRGPSLPALLAILLSFFYKKKIYLHKYAGGWNLESVPFSYSFQRWLLKKQKRGYVLVSTSQVKDSPLIKTLPNPCLEINEIKTGFSAMELKNYSNGLRICFVGKCVASKGIFEVLKTLNILADENNLANCTIAGLSNKNELRSRLNHRANQLTSIVGVLPRDVLNRVYADSHFILLPSRSEGFPKVLAEAAAFGCIPVVFNLPGFDKIINSSVNGILLEDLHPEKIVEKLKEVWADQIHIKKMARAANEFSKQFLYDSFVHSVKQMIINR